MTTRAVARWLRELIWHLTVAASARRGDVLAGEGPRLMAPCCGAPVRFVVACVAVGRQLGRGVIGRLRPLVVMLMAVHTGHGARHTRVHGRVVGGHDALAAERQ